MLQSFYKKAGIFLLMCVLLWTAGRYLLPIAMPFLLAFLLALTAEPLVRVLRERRRHPRWASAGVGVSVALTLAVLVVLTLCAFVLRQVGRLANVMPDLESTAQQGLATLENFLLDMAHRAPGSVSPMLTRGVEGLFSDGGALLNNASDTVLRLASGVVTRIPDSALGLGTWLIASYMLSARLPQLKQAVKERLPASWREQVLPAAQRLRQTLSGWLLAQLKLTGVTFLVLSAGFLLLGIRHGVLWAAVVSLLDALPVLGTGTVLVPWSVVSFLQGEPVRAVGLLGTYAAAAVLRSILEPKFLGKQLGLDPLVTLLALYAGFRLWGIGGMILAPLLTAVILLMTRKQ